MNEKEAETGFEELVSTKLENEVYEEENGIDEKLRMDYTLQTPEERKERVEYIISKTPPEKLTPKYLEKLTDYIIFAMDKEERKRKNILTDNHMVTVNKRETSFEGLVGKMENGEDGIYNMIANDKNIIFSPKAPITDADVEEIPGLRELRDAIEVIKKQFAGARGKKAFLLKKQIIEMSKDQFVLKAMFKKPIYCTNLIKSFPKIDLDEEVGIDEDGNVYSTGLINFYDEKHVSALLCNYSKLKEDSWSSFSGDSKWMIMDFEKLVDDTLEEDFPMYYDLVIYKIDGRTNEEIQELLYEKYGIRHSEEYLSSLWRNKIPKMIANRAAEDWLVWHYTFEEKGKWKRCSRCGQIKLADNHFFSKNNTSKDGLYSICKCCRNAAYQARKQK